MLILAKIIGVSTISPRPVLEIFQGSVMYIYVCTVLSVNVPLLKKMSRRAFMAQGQRHLSRDRTCPVCIVPEVSLRNVSHMLNVWLASFPFPFFFLTFFFNCPPTTTSHVFLESLFNQTSHIFLHVLEPDISFSGQLYA